MLDRASVCQKWLLQPVGSCCVQTAAVRNGEFLRLLCCPLARTDASAAASLAVHSLRTVCIN